MSISLNTGYYHSSDDLKSTPSSERRFESIKCSVLSWFLPKKTKRLIFLASIFSVIKNTPEPSKCILNKFNNLLRTSEFVESLALPIYFGQYVWRDRFPLGIYLTKRKLPSLNLEDIDKKSLTQAEMRIVAANIIEAMPKYLVYSSKRTMRADIHTLLENLPQLNCVNKNHLS